MLSPDPFKFSKVIRCSSTLLPPPSLRDQDVWSKLKQANAAQIVLMGVNDSGAISELDGASGYARQPMPALAMHSADRRDSAEAVTFTFSAGRPAKTPINVGIYADADLVFFGDLNQVGALSTTDGVSQVTFQRGALRFIAS